MINDPFRHGREGTDRQTSLRSDEHSTSPESVFQIPGTAVPLHRNTQPLFSNIYMRRFILGWKVLGYARRFEAEIVNYADDCAPRRRGKEAEMAT